MTDLISVPEIALYTLKNFREESYSSISTLIFHQVQVVLSQWDEVARIQSQAGY